MVDITFLFENGQRYLCLALNFICFSGL